MTDVNSTLPDDDALAAFADNALGGRRRRRKRDEGEGTPAAASDTSPSPETEGAPSTSNAPAAAEEVPATADPAPAPKPAAAAEPEPARTIAAEPRPELVQATEATTPAGEERPAVPSQTSPDRQADVAPAVEESTPATRRGELEVRAVTVPVTREPLPPGLVEGGVIEVRVPDLGPAGIDATQCTIMISSNVRDRFARYQLEKKMAGDPEPSNALVVRRAFLHARRNDLFVTILRERYHQTNAVDEEDYDEDGLLGEVVGRRTVRGRLRDSGQQSFRPSKQELATYDAFQTAYGFSDRSAFLEGVLDQFLPQLPTSGRRR
ncbi:hypothetical protein ABZ619_39205 [Streptomyces sp. NPDC007851]|uniref:hypothetical protein n=1 Tax=Streptomyces sp. NPDC007851 TaxID=3155008 RepID=UPI0033C9F7CC